jgi:hypothetical protein
VTGVASDGTWGCGPAALGGEERFWVEDWLLAADAAEFELVAAHGDADAAFDSGGELGEEVSALDRGSGGAIAEVGHLGAGEGFDFSVEDEEILLGLGDLFREAGELRGGGLVVAGVGGGVVAVEHALEEVAVVAVEGGVGLGHEVVAVELVVGTAGAVWVDALGYLAEEGLEVECCGIRFVGWCWFRTGFWFEGLGLRLGWIVEFGDAVFPLVELDVEDADLADVAALETVELGAEVVEIGFAGGQFGAEVGELSAAAEELGVFRSGAAGDRGASGHGLV